MSREFDQPIVDIVNYVYHHQIHDDAAFSAAQMALLDALGCAIETVSKSEACRRMLGPVVPGTTVPNGSRIPGTDLELDPVKGAFDLGTLIRYLDHNDALGGAEWGHPSDNLGAILAVADWICRSEQGGKDVRGGAGPEMNVKTILEALIKAYEVQGCYQMRNAFNSHGMDHVVLVKLAVAGVVSWLMGLSEEQAKAVLSHVWMDGAPTRVYRSGADTVPRKGWAAGDAGSRAVFLALLVKSGQAGSPGALTAKRWGFLNLHKFGEGEKSAFDLPKPFGSWVVKNIFFKVMPVEGHGISGVEAALISRKRLLAQGGEIEVVVKKIQKITVRTTAAAHLIINKQGSLTNPADRDHCIQYCMALALLKGSYPEAVDYQDESPYATSPILEALRAKIDIVKDDKLTQDYLDINIRSVGAGMTIFLEDGQQLEEVLVEFPPGHAGNERTKILQGEKFRRNMGLMFDAREVEIIQKVVLDASASVSDLMSLLVRTNGPASARL